MLKHLLLRSDSMLRQALPLLDPQMSPLYAHLMGPGKLDALILLIFRVSEESLDTSNNSKQLLMPVLSCNVFHDYRMRPIC
jgi:hypothetical protein